MQLQQCLRYLEVILTWKSNVCALLWAANEVIRAWPELSGRNDVKLQRSETRNSLKYAQNISPFSLGGMPLIADKNKNNWTRRLLAWSSLKQKTNIPVKNEHASIQQSKGKPHSTNFHRDFRCCDRLRHFKSRRVHDFDTPAIQLCGFHLG